ncbi:MAG: tripartite tricarboxylate transporter permease, partial [Nanoarchaeota archaeon]
FTGLSPGIHINLVAAFLVSISAALLTITSPITLVIFIVSMGITHTFIDFIPSIFLGAPEEDTALSVLPGHQLLIEGKGYEAVKLSAYGSLFSTLTIILILPIFLFVLPKIQNLLQIIIPIFLILSSGYIFYTEKNRIAAIIVFLLSGFLGISVLNSNLNLTEPLLPLFTGLFGISSLIVSIKSKTKIPPQETKIKINKKDLIQPLFASFVIAPLCSIIPGIGSSQAAVISSTLIESTNKRFLVLLGAASTTVLGLSFIVLYSLNKSRSGLAVMIEKLMPEISSLNLGIIILTIVISSLIAFFLAIYIGKLFAKNINKINYTKLSIYIILFLNFIVLIFSGLYGFLILIVSTLLGLYCIISGVKRINLMACLILPTILIYLL